VRFTGAVSSHLSFRFRRISPLGPVHLRHVRRPPASPLPRVRLLLQLILNVVPDPGALCFTYSLPR